MVKVIFEQNRSWGIASELEVVRTYCRLKGVDISSYLPAGSYSFYAFVFSFEYPVVMEGFDTFEEAHAFIEDIKSKY